MPSKRRWFRVEPKGLVSRTAKIFLPGETLECRVVDLSAGGTCLELPRQIILPHHFDLMHGGVRRPCRLAWHKGFRVGIQYLGSARR
jgi:hypothetical protein